MYENIKTVEAGGFSSTAMGFLKGMSIAAIFTFLIFAVFSVILSYTPLPEDAIPVISFATQVLGSAIAGFLPAKRAGTRGIVTGAVSAFFYMLIIWLAASLISDGFYVGAHVITMFVLSAISGAIGGIMGVNLKSSNNNKKKR